MNYEKIALNLQQRIGEMAARYETDIAVLQSQAQERIEALEHELAHLRSGETEAETTEA